MSIRKATANDFEILKQFRYAYLNEENGGISAEDSSTVGAQLDDYFARHLGNDFTAYIYEIEGTPVSVIFYITMEKPANLHFINGHTAFLMNVYTLEKYRGLGCAGKLLDEVIKDAKSQGVTAIDLSATPMGRPLYLKKGFFIRNNSEMRLKIR